MTRIGVVGASARAAVHSLARAGFSAWSVDQFADRDLKRVAPCAVCPPGRYPDAIPELAAQLPPGAVLYTGGLENYPHIVAELASQRELWGNPPEVLARVRDPFTLFPAFADAGFAVPRLVPRGEPCPAEGRWLRKPFRSGGGRGIRFAQPGEAASPHHYFQEFIEGPPMSAQFVNSRLIGVTQQLVGESWLHATPFAYCGNVGPITPPEHTALLGGLLCEQTRLRGVWGVDFVLHSGRPIVLEVNPRYTAGIEALELATGIAVFRPEPTPPGPPSLKGRGEEEEAPSFSPLPFREGGPGGVGLAPPVGKAIYYAPRDLTFPPSGPWDADLTGDFDPWRLPGFADIPEAGSAVEAGSPVLTFFAAGSAPTEVRQRLQSRAAELDRLLLDEQP